MVDVRKLFFEDECYEQDDGDCDENDALCGHDLLE
jgi:hypothetical protein